MTKEQQIEISIYKATVSIIFFIITYKAVLSIWEFTDYLYHVSIASEFTIFNLKDNIISGNTYFIFHMMVSFLYNICKFPLGDSAGIVVGLANVVSLNIVIHYMETNENGESNLGLSKSAILLGCALMMVGPLYMPWINQEYYVGQWSPNIYHNPTSIICRPFALVCMFSLFKILKDDYKERKEYVKCSIFLAISALAKPSFLQIIIPAMVLFVILRVVITKKIEWKKWISLIAVFLPSCILILLQAFIIFYSGNTLSEGIGIEYGRMLHYFTSNIGASFFMTMAFPIFVIISNLKALVVKPYIQLIICLLFASWMEMAFLYEKGLREVDGNFAWGYMLAAFLVWVVVTKEFRENIYTYNEKKTKIIFIIGIIIFSLHLIFNNITITFGV